MAVHVYINFNGNCREAVDYYAKVFETESPKYLTFGEMPQDPNFPMPEEAKHLIMHTRLKILGNIVMFSDLFPGMSYIQGNNISIALVDKDTEKLTQYFKRLSEGGKIEMKLQKTDWTECYGSLTDKFGIHWQFDHDNGVHFS